MPFSFFDGQSLFFGERPYDVGEPVRFVRIINDALYGTTIEGGANNTGSVLKNHDLRNRNAPLRFAAHRPKSHFFLASTAQR